MTTETILGHSAPASEGSPSSRVFTVELSNDAVRRKGALEKSLEMLRSAGASKDVVARFEEAIRKTGPSERE